VCWGSDKCIILVASCTTWIVACLCDGGSAVVVMEVVAVVAYSCRSPIVLVCAAARDAQEAMQGVQCRGNEAVTTQWMVC
jgi:hypothetical protein